MTIGQVGVKVEIPLHATKISYERPALKIYGSVQLLTQGSVAITNGDGGQNMMNPSSDRRLKQNIVQIGQHPQGFALYLFDYKPEHRVACGFGRRFGVMADEVSRVVPAAVYTASDGYMRVDYSQLGIRLGA